MKPVKINAKDDFTRVLFAAVVVVVVLVIVVVVVAVNVAERM